MNLTAKKKRQFQVLGMRRAAHLIPPSTCNIFTIYLCLHLLLLGVHCTLSGIQSRSFFISSSHPLLDDHLSYDLFIDQPLGTSPRLLQRVRNIEKGPNSPAKAAIRNGLERQRDTRGTRDRPQERPPVAPCNKS